MKSNLTLLATLAISTWFTNSCSTGSSGQRGNGGRMKERINQVDANRDGLIDEREFSTTRIAERAEDPTAVFKKLDRNGDGYLDSGEIQAAIQTFRSQRGR